ncbi:pilus assembly protein [Chamaesiphon sp.]|uniref:pilus assembly protein n=1 Tax=Chamaesiphon sp. TaxID=2814140 RepID=UPI00359306FE
MTYNSEFIESELVTNTSFVTAPAYPSIFGVTFNPIAIGSCIAVAGMGLSGYLYLNFVQPQSTKNQELETKLAQIQDQIQQRRNTATQIAAAERNLERANVQKKLVVGLFASDKKLDTLLLDLNKLVNIRNGELQGFRPDVPVAGTGSSGAAVVADSSLGAALNNKIKRKGVQVDVKGNFDQLQSIFRTIERLDQLLLVKEFRAIVPDPQKAVFNAQGKPIVQPEAPISISFKIQALIPMTPAEQAAALPLPSARPK